MTLVQIKEALTAKVLDLWVGQPMELAYENVESIDITDHPQGVVRFIIDWDGSKQANLAENPFHRKFGQAVFQIFLPVNSGNKKAYAVVDYLIANLGFKDLGALHLQTPSPGKAVTRNGWYSIELRIPFYNDSNT